MRIRMRKRTSLRPRFYLHKYIHDDVNTRYQLLCTRGGTVQNCRSSRFSDLSNSAFDEVERKEEKKKKQFSQREMENK